MKIGYRTLDGYRSTAYLDCDAHPDGWDCGHGDDGNHTGINKYTDEPVTVRWNDTEWIEIST